ncbi:MAG: ABC transporter permease [Planctomycetes bacterium]|nr:ABC transporter permease [Planctomycetota bacterium]
MNANILAALFQDSLQQVLDNRVFRLLVIMTICMVAPTFLIGFHQDHISMLWMWEYSYSELTATLGVPVPPDVRPDEMLIKGIQTVVIEGIAGVAGIIFCIAATAFFVPRMLEKGAADTLFSKPISRTALLVMRYFSGLLFVTVLSFALVGGMWTGFALVSGYTDTGFLWSAVTLVYLYALLHSFSVLVGTVTRSSVAAILLVLMMFMFSGCVHRGWVFKEYAQESYALEVLRIEMREEGSGELREEEEEDSTLLNFLTVLLDTLHYTLPKTGDATTITGMLREAVEGTGPALNDTEASVVFEDHPEGMTLIGSSTPDFDEPVTWVPRDPDADARQRVFLKRRGREPEEAPAPGERVRRLVASRVASAFEDGLDERADRGELLSGPSKERAMFGPNQLIAVRWEEGSESDGLHRSRFFFHFSEWLYEIDLTVPHAMMGDEAYEEWEDDFFRGLSIGTEQFRGPMQWYEDEFGWDAPWKFNAFFSIGTSLAFALFCLLLSIFRLNRYDF